MRMNYKSYPTDYVQQLKREHGKRGRKKSRAFLEYWDDMEHGHHNGERFYAESWEVSRSTVHEWIKEFAKEVDLFLDHWHLRNKQHYTYAKNQTETIETIKPRQSRPLKHSTVGDFIETTETIETTQPSEVFNLYDNNSACEPLRREWWNDPEFNDLFFIYSQNTKFVGKKEDAYEVFQRVDIDHSLLILSAMQYLHDPDTLNKRYNLSNFLKNEIFLAYMPKRISINTNGKWVDMNYNKDTGELIADGGGRSGTLTPKMMIEMFKDGSLKFIKPAGRAA